MSSFKRKVYGRVRPVPKAKPKAPAKPSVQELKTIFRNIQKSPDWKTLDHISEALIWWDKAFGYCAFIYQKKGQSLETAQALVKGKTLLQRGHTCLRDKDKTGDFVSVLKHYARYAAPVLKTPDITPFLKKSKEVTKKTVAVNKALAVRYDKILTLLSQCFRSCKIKLAVVAEIDKGLPRKFDHAVGTMYYSRSHVNDMKSTLHKKGLLALVISEAIYLARGMSWQGETVKDGQFIVDWKLYAGSYINLMSDFEEFSHHKDAPRSLVRKAKKPVAIKKVFKAGAKALSKQEVLDA